MKLWVDDIRKAPGDEWTVARSVLSAIRAIAQFEFDVISLDHDISHQVSIGTGLERPYPCEETFESVAHYIALKYNMERMPGSPRVPLVVLHTSNPAGAKRMEEILEPHVNVERRAMGAANRLEMEV